MQDKKVVLCIALIMLITLSTIATASAFIHPDGSEDGYFEIFGPRIDKLVIRKYANLDAEIIALQNGEIDITDSPLTAAWASALASDSDIGIAEYGGENGYYAINFNHNNNTYLGNPPDPTFPNPVFPNPMSEPALRQACAYLVNRTALTEDAGKGLYDPIYTPIPAYMTYWIHPEIKPGGTFENLTYPFDQTFAVPAALLETGGFPIGPDGWRYWDMNRNSIKDTGEDLALKVYRRTDVLRNNTAYMLCAGLDNSAIKIHYSLFSPYPIPPPYPWAQKNYHVYMIGWIYIGPEPDYLWDLYHWDNYYYDGSWSNCPNMGSISINDPVMQEQLETIEKESDGELVFNACLAFQERFAETASEVPLASTSAPKAHNKWYTGGNDGTLVDPDDGENAYRHANWDQIVNQKGQGENSWWSTLSMYPVGHPWGDGTYMTLRCGWQYNDMPAVVNPIFSSWYWENEIWSRVIDSGGARSPYTLGPVEAPQLMENWTIGTWIDPSDLLTKAKITVRMRPDVFWNDGVQAGIDDFIYTLTQLPVELVAKGCADAWWKPTADQIAGVFKIDQYTAEILMAVNSYFAVNWIVGNVILPKHWWQPFVAGNTPDVIQGDIAPGDLIGTGPYLYVSNTPGVSVTMLRNPNYYQPDEVSVIKNGPESGIDFTANAPSTQISPVKIKDVNLATHGDDGYFDVKVTVQNLHRYNSVTFDETITLTYAGPNAPGTPITLHTGTHTLDPGAIYVCTFTQVVRDGLWTVSITVQKTGGVAHTSSKNVYVTVKADLDGDWKVNILDITPIAIGFGSTMGDGRYDPSADLNREGKINILDIVQVASAFGWTAWDT